MLWIILGFFLLVVLFYVFDARYASQTNKAIATYEANLAKDSHGIIKGNEPIQHLQEEPACLLIHGYRGSPAVFAELIEELNNEKISFDAILLPGHGRGIGELSDVRWPNWYAAVESAYFQLRTQRKKVFVVGFSLGGLLAFHLASKHPVDGIVAISPSFEINPKCCKGLSPSLRLWFAKWLLFTRTFRIKRKPDIHDETIRDQFDNHSFYPIQTTRSLFDFGKSIFKETNQLPSPLLILQSRHDNVVQPSRVESFFLKVHSPDKERHWYEDSGHELLIDRERTKVFERILEFIEKHS